MDFSWVILMGVGTALFVLWGSFELFRLRVIGRRAAVLRVLANQVVNADDLGEAAESLKSVPWLLDPYLEWEEQCWTSENSVRNDEQAGAYITADVVEPSSWSFLDVAPGMLTGLGILGTFLGIVYGLSDIGGALDAIGATVQVATDNKAATNRLFEATSILVEGLKASFGTSILGLSLSMVASARHRHIDSKLDAGRLSLVHALDRKVRRGVAQQILLSIHADAKIWARQAAEHHEARFAVLSTVAKSAEDQVNELKQMLSAVHEAVEEGIQSSGIIGAMTQMAESVSQSQADGMVEALQQLQDVANDQMSDSFEQVRESAHLMVKSQDAFVENIGTMVQQLSTGTEQQIEASTQVQAAIGHATKAVAGIERTVSVLNASAVEIHKASESMHVAIGSQRRAIDEQREINTGVMSAISTQSEAWARHQGAIETAHSGIESRFGTLEGCLVDLVGWHNRVHGSLQKQMDTWLEAVQTQDSLTQTLAEERLGWKDMVQGLDHTSTQMSAIAEQLVASSKAIVHDQQRLQHAQADGLERLAEGVQNLRLLNEAQKASAESQRLMSEDLLGTVKQHRDDWSGHQLAVVSAYQTIDSQFKGMGTALDGLVEWHDRVKGSLEVQVESWATAARQQNLVSARMKEQEARWRSIVTDLASATKGLQGLGGLLSGLGAKLRENMGSQESQSQATSAQMMEVVSKFEQLGSSMDDSWKDYADVAQKLGSGLPDVMQLLEGLNGAVRRQEALVVNAGLVADRFKETAGTQQELRKQLQLIAQTTKVTGEAMKPTAQLLIRSAQALEKATVGLRGTNDHMQGAAASIKTAATVLSQRDREAVQHWQKVDQGLRVSATAMTGALDQYTTNVNGVVTKTFRQFDGEMGKVVGDLNGGVSAMHQLIMAMHELLESMPENVA